MDDLDEIKTIRRNIENLGDGAALDHPADMLNAVVIEKVILNAQPTKRFVQVEQIAALVLFAATDSAPQITGFAQLMEGGWEAQLSQNPSFVDPGHP